MDIWIVRYRGLGENEWVSFRMFSGDGARDEWTERACASIRAAQGRGDVTALCEVDLLDPRGVIVMHLHPDMIKAVAQ